MTASRCCPDNTRKTGEDPSHGCRGDSAGGSLGADPSHSAALRPADQAVDASYHVAFFVLATIEVPGGRGASGSSMRVAPAVYADSADPQVFLARAQLLHS